MHVVNVQARIILNWRQFRENLTVFTASTMEEEKKWKKRRPVRIQANSSVGVAVGIQQQPGPSRLQQEVSVVAATPDEGSTLTDEGESSLSENNFDDKTAQPGFVRRMGC